MMETTPRICVIGAGTMGRGIAQVALAAGHVVTLVDPQHHQLEAASADIAKRLAKRHPDIVAVLDGRLLLAASLDLVDAHAGTVVVEAVLEDLVVKTSVLSAAADRFGPSCILATNTSSLSVTQIAAGTPLPHRVVGMHFFNPVPAMKLVEVIRGIQTDAAVADAIAELATSWGKHVARVRSAPGFIVNRVARAFYGEPLRLVEEQAAQPATIDAVMRGAGGFRMGPFELMDLIGNDVNAAVTRLVWTAFHFDPRFTPSRIQDELVAAGRLGRKSGHGFYAYGVGDKDAARPTARPTVTRPPESPPAVDGDDQLAIFAQRGGSGVYRADRAVPRIELASGTVLQVTRGRTARSESAQAGAPVVLIDRCLDAVAATDVAIAASHDGAIADAVAFLAAAGVTAHVVADAPGLVVARTLSMIANEAHETVLHGVAAADDVDLAMRLGTNYPAGPFEWTESWGAAAVLEVLDELWATYHDGRYRASRLLRETAG